MENVNKRKFDLGSTPMERKKLKEKRKEEKRRKKEELLLSKLVKEKQQKEIEVKEAEEHEDELKTYEKQGRHYTVSIALPGSILDNAQSPELRAYLAGQIARAAVVFNVDEIIIFDESGSLTKNESGDIEALDKRGQCNVQMARILQYLECPQYLRKAFFPYHKDLQFAGLLNPLDCPHHMRADDICKYREGVVLNRPVKNGKGSFVNVGVLKECQIDRLLQANLRVTVKIENPENEEKKMKGKVVPPSAPRTEAGIYWGYTVRVANSLGAVFIESPYDGGYDTTIGTSEKGSNLESLSLQKFRHLLVVFGGLQGLEASLDADNDLKVDEPSLLFDHYLNTCPNQGSSTIRTEEAILISLSALRPAIQQATKKS